MRHPALRSPRCNFTSAFVTALVLAAAAGPARAGVNFWTPLGPDGGNVDALAAVPAQPGVLFAGSFGGGVFRSADGGASWVHASRGITDLTVTALAVDPRSPDTVYASAAAPGASPTTTCPETQP
ncbi:MAG: hypothetical protein JOZ15_19015 [Acidobacteria bacterium]|nr:hypothetical protein [Acidobacteriota bacterium]